ncbi:mobile element protein [Fusibacter sp. 3D3]|nr:mobile element protein [Fusibacter sp. 3D3]GAU78547.1 mobile element protein [Fusibacter sp. 3D3]
MSNCKLLKFNSTYIVKFMRLDFSRCSKCPLEPSNCDTVMQEATPHIGAG